MNALLLPSASLSKAEHLNLRQKLDQFYAEATGYTAFQQPSNQRNCWAHVLAQIEKQLTSGQGKIHVLEIGAGKTGFARFLQENGIRSRVIFHAQDVTSFNETWLRAEADYVYMGDVADAGIPAMMNLVFSTYALEHVTDPAQHLASLWRLLSNGGSLFLFSPRYDLPGYLCPSARHLSKLVQIRFLAAAAIARLKTLVTGKPQFLIQTDLAAFHQPFYLDADAVHWVSVYDLSAWARQKGARLKRLQIRNPNFASKDWMIKRFCTTAVCIETQ